VRITEGPFAGFIAKVRSASPQKRVRLILGNLGEAQVDPAFIERLGRAERFTLVA
jgi:transcription antitermination factor NusG